MKSTLKLFTSHVSEERLKKISGAGYLPVFAIRHINRSPLLGRYSNAPVHFRALSPSEHLTRSLENKEISHEVYEKEYVIEMSKVCFQDIIKRLEYLAEYNGAKGIVIMTPGKEGGDCYRKALGLILNFSGLLETPVTEYDIE